MCSLLPGTGHLMGRSCSCCIVQSSKKQPRLLPGRLVKA